ncbi:MAG: ribonuclease R [Bacteroidales bacterium]|nr:ribonuclease R [Bacteroidales bacterium]
MAKSLKKKKPAAGKNTFVHSVLNVFTSHPQRSFNFRQISHALGAQDKGSRQLVKDILSDLEARNEIIQLRRGKYQLHPDLAVARFTGSTVTGIVDMKQTGKAYVITPDLPEDVYIASNNTHRALNGDKVRVHLFPKRKNRKTEGRIVEVIERSRVQFVGILEVSPGYAFLVPDDTSVPVDIYIPREKLHGAQNGQKVLARMTDWPEHSRNPFGEVVQVLGRPGDHNVEMDSILADRGFPLSFPAGVEKAAKKIQAGITPEEIARRKDFREVFTCTIDPQDAKDYDDALSLRPIGDDRYEIGVHIADVSHYVPQGGVIDKEAFERGTSVYMVDRVIPMLPEQLSNNVCSLRPMEEKLCFSAVFELDKEAQVHKEWFGRSVIRSDRRYNYDEVQKILEGGDDLWAGQLQLLDSLAKKLRKERFSKGSINFSTQEVKFELDEQGKPVHAWVKEQMDSNRLIEDFMLLANRRVAEKMGRRYGKQEPKTFVYRIHDEPNPEKLKTFSEFLGRLGYRLNTQGRKAISSSLNQLFRAIEGKGEANMIETIAVRTMAKAEYSTENIGHYGLAFRYYTHFTSPIRRYPDLMVHRLLDRYMNGQPSVQKQEYEEKCEHASDMERRAQEAERASIKYKQAEYLMDKVGMEFDGLISGVSKWGIFVELEGSKCEGMISLRHMDDDFYFLDEENYRVIGQSFGKEYRLGDPVRVVVRKIDLARKQIDFVMT